jgi:hypothetical protein
MHRIEGSFKGAISLSLGKELYKLMSVSDPTDRRNCGGSTRWNLLIFDMFSAKAEQKRISRRGAWNLYKERTAKCGGKKSLDRV